mgnify:CR=1 FL=1
MQKKFSFKNNRLAKTIVFSGTVLIIVAFIIMRYEGFFAVVSAIMNIFPSDHNRMRDRFCTQPSSEFFSRPLQTSFCNDKKFIQKQKARQKDPFGIGKTAFYCGVSDDISSYYRHISRYHLVYCTADIKQYNSVQRQFQRLR